MAEPTRTSRYLLQSLESWRGAPIGLDADTAPRWVVEWLGAMAWGQYLEILRYEHGEGLGIVGSRAGLGELLDDFWCRHLIKEVPSIVDRVQKLEPLATQKSPNDFVCLFFAQAMKCYAIGLPEAAVALIRACLEHSLRDTLSHAEGIKELEALIRFAGHRRRLDTAQMQMAYRLRALGNDVMHKKSCTSEEAFEAVTLLRALIAALYGCVDDDWDSSTFSSSS